jgi:hypothetical protein
MKSRLARLLYLSAASAALAAGLLVPATNSAASAAATTTCIPNGAHPNAGMAGGGSTYWGWCKTNGGYVNYRVQLVCPDPGGGVTGWASATGGEVYTVSETCWFGDKPCWYNLWNSNGHNYFGLYWSSWDPFACNPNFAKTQLTPSG